MTDTFQPELLQSVARVVSDYVSNNEIAAEALPDIIRFTYTAFIRACRNEEKAQADAHKAAVAANKSVTRPAGSRPRNGATSKSNKRSLNLSHDVMLNAVQTQPDSTTNYAMEALSANEPDTKSASARKAIGHLAEPGSPASAEVQRIPEGVSGLKQPRRKTY